MKNSIRKQKKEIEALKEDHIELVSYDPDWSNQANTEMTKLCTILPASNIIDIQHVGSTAIPGIAAKPIIDIQIAVNSLDEIKTIAIPLLKKAGYEYWHENPDSERMFFVKGMPPFGTKRTHHVHIVESTSRHWKEKIAFRDYLITHSDVAHEYEKLKKELAKKYQYDREKYTDAKTRFIKKILLLADSGNIKNA